MYDLKVEVKLKTISCANCGVDFYLSANFISHLKISHESFYCPKGHSNYFPGKSDNEKLQDQLKKTENRLRIEREYKEEYQKRLIKERNSKIAIKGHQTRLKKRIANGVCPCCNRTFDNLADHMKQKHPKYSSEN